MTTSSPTPAKADETTDLRDSLAAWLKEANDGWWNSTCLLLAVKCLNGPLAPLIAAHAAEIQAQEAEIARLKAALTLIASASPEPDDKDWRDIWNDPASYRWLGTDGVVRESSVDISNRDDVESFGYERGLHAAALIARAALPEATTPKETSDV